MGNYDGIDPSPLPERHRAIAGLGMGITIFTPAAYPVYEYRRSDAASALLADPVHPDFSTIANDVREIFGMAWSGICVVAGEVQHVIASSGGMLGMYKRSTALSGYVVADPGRVFVVPDARQDNRFAGNPFVADGLIRFYAGAAIFDHAGYALGALCITDRKPRDALSDDDQERLTRMAAKISTLAISSGKTNEGR